MDQCKLLLEWLHRAGEAREREITRRSVRIDTVGTVPWREDYSDQIGFLARLSPCTGPNSERARAGWPFQGCSKGDSSLPAPGRPAGGCFGFVAAGRPAGGNFGAATEAEFAGSCASELGGRGESWAVGQFEFW